MFSSSPYFFVISRLCRAATNGDLESVKQLATKDNVNTRGWLGWSPLHKAAQLGHHAVVKYLLGEKFNASVDIRDMENHTPLLLAAGTNQETLGHIEVVKELISKGADVNATDDGQYSSLHLAVLNSNYEIALALLDAKCNVNHLNQDKFTALHTACSQAHVKFIHLLLDFGADHTIKDARGKTPIDLARRVGINLNICSDVIEQEKVDEQIPPEPTNPIQTSIINRSEEEQLQTEISVDTDLTNSTLAAEMLLNEIHQVTRDLIH